MPPSTEPVTFRQGHEDEHFAFHAPLGFADGSGEMNHPHQLSPPSSSARQQGYEADNDEEEDNHLAVWESPSWTQSLLRLRWCCPGGAATPFARGSESHDALCWDSSHQRFRPHQQQFHRHQQLQQRQYYPMGKYQGQSDLKTWQTILSSGQWSPHQVVKHGYPSHAGHYPQLLRVPPPYPIPPSFAQFQSYQQSWLERGGYAHDSIESLSSTSSSSFSSCDFSFGDSLPAPTPRDHQQHLLTVEGGHDDAEGVDEKRCEGKYVTPPPSQRRRQQNRPPKFPGGTNPAASAAPATTSKKKMVKKPMEKPPLVKRRSSAPASVRSEKTPSSKKKSSRKEVSDKKDNGCKSRPGYLRSQSASRIKKDYKQENSKRLAYRRSQSERGFVSSTPPRSPHRQKLPPSGLPGSPGPSPAPARSRIVSDFSKASMATTSSRHRRQAHESFEFDACSLQRITGEQHRRQNTVPLTYIHCPSVGESASRTGSPCDDDITGSDLKPQATWSWESDDDCSLSLSSDDEGDAGYISPVDEDPDLFSPKSVIQENIVASSANCVSDSQKKSGLSLPRTGATATAEVCSTLFPEETDGSNDSTVQPDYLPTCPVFDDDATGTIIVSGWAAISMSDVLLYSFLSVEDDDKFCLERADIAYFQLIQFNDEETGKTSHKIFIQGNENSSGLSVDLVAGYQVVSREAGSRAGRCVVLQDGWTREVLCTILPVSLPGHFFGSCSLSSLVAEPQFGQLAHTMFTPFGETEKASSTSGTRWEEQNFRSLRYAPDAQNDASMHILFALDAALSKKNSLSLR